MAYVRQARRQIESFAEADKRMRAAFSDTNQRSQLGGHPGWADSLAAVPEPLRYRHLWDLGTEHYLALVLLAQISKIVDRLPGDALPACPGTTPVKLLRDLEEHWDEVDGRARRMLRASDSTIARAGQIEVVNDVRMIGSASEAELIRWLNEIEAGIRAAADRAGLPVPLPDDEVGIST